MNFSLLVCPKTKKSLIFKESSCIQNEWNILLSPVTRIDSSNQNLDLSSPIGLTDNILMVEKSLNGYPIIHDIPILLAPEQLIDNSQKIIIDLADCRYAEAYQEMNFYNQLNSNDFENISTSEAYQILKPLYDALSLKTLSFPNPYYVWVDAIYDNLGQYEAYKYLNPIMDNRILQLGGNGIHAVKFLLAGASEAWVLSPMLGELIFAKALARIFGVDQKLFCAVGIAEEMPFADNIFDAIYSGGCLHHMSTEIALPEISRVLKKHGRFVAVDPWKTPLFDLGIKIFGKRETEVFCRPLNPERLSSLKNHFVEYSINHHGAITRHLLLALNKLSVKISMKVSWRIIKIDDYLSSIIPGFKKRFGSSISLCAKK